MGEGKIYINEWSNFKHILFQICLYLGYNFGLFVAVPLMPVALVHCTKWTE